MLQKTFQICLVILVVILTSLAGLLIFSTLLSVLMPLHTDGIVAVPGGISFSIIKIVVPVVVVLLIAGIYLVVRPKLR